MAGSPKRMSQRLRDALRKYNKPGEVKTYPGCPHAFFNDTRKEVYRPAEAARRVEANPVLLPTTSSIIAVPTARRFRPPFHTEDWHTPQGRFIREVMFGINDGLVSTIGFVAGATGSLMQTRLVLLAGIASVVAGALSMGIGAYLASKSQREFFESEKAREHREIEEVPEDERKEIRDIYARLGFQPDEVEMIVRRITSNKDLWVQTMMREELGILEETVNPATIGLLMMVAFTSAVFRPSCRIW